MGYYNKNAAILNNSVLEDKGVHRWISVLMNYLSK